MARINIEDTIWSDPRFIALTGKVGRTDSALGSLVMAWMAAQGFWKRDRSSIPEDVFMCIPGAVFIIECGMAIKRADGIYMKGSEDQFLWLEQRISASKKGGESNKKRALADRDPTGSRPGAGMEPTGSPLTLTLSQRKKKTYAHAAACAFDFESIYRAYPKKIGMARGLKALSAGVKTQADFDAAYLAVGRYAAKVAFEETEMKFVKQFDTWARNWREIDREILEQTQSAQAEAPKAFKL